MIYYLSRLKKIKPLAEIFNIIELDESITNRCIKISLSDIKNSPIFKYRELYQMFEDDNSPISYELCFSFGWLLKSPRRQIPYKSAICFLAGLLSSPLITFMPRATLSNIVYDLWYSYIASAKRYQKQPDLFYIILYTKRFFLIPRLYHMHEVYEILRTAKNRVNEYGSLIFLDIIIHHFIFISPDIEGYSRYYLKYIMVEPDTQYNILYNNTSAPLCGNLYLEYQQKNRAYNDSTNRYMIKSHIFDVKNHIQCIYLRAISKLNIKDGEETRKKFIELFAIFDRWVYINNPAMEANKE